jgi:predicted RND superfamily exporter protein
VHRRLFRKQLKKTLVSSADRIAKVALTGVALLSAGTASLVFDVTAGRDAGLLAGGGLLTAMVLLLVLVPNWLLKRASKV